MEKSDKERIRQELLKEILNLIDDYNILSSFRLVGKKIREHFKNEIEDDK